MRWGGGGVGRGGSGLACLGTSRAAGRAPSPEPRAPTGLLAPLRGDRRDAESLEGGEDGRVVVAGDVQDPEGALVEGAEDRVVDEHQVARLLDAELHDGRAAG